MDWWPKLLLSALFILFAPIDESKADSIVTGTVFCDQCKDGHVSLFDYPIQGVKVEMACSDGQITTSREEITGWFGNYVMRFDGQPDLSNCYVHVSSNDQSSNGCVGSAGPAQKLRLTYQLFDMQFYTADVLLSQPAQPMSFCPRSTTPALPPPVRSPEISPPANPYPPFRLPPLPPLPSLPSLPPLPPMTSLETSVCTYQNWSAPDYRCYWKTLNPDMKVAFVFGYFAARRYGTDITLSQALQGRGDPYRTLLREATTALLNSYNNLQFSYNSIDVVTHMNQALIGSNTSVLLTALRFLRANSGSSNVTCKFTACAN